MKVIYGKSKDFWQSISDQPNQLDWREEGREGEEGNSEYRKWKEVKGWPSGEDGRRGMCRWLDEGEETQGRILMHITLIAGRWCRGRR